MTSAPVFSILMRTTGRAADVATALASVVAQTADRAQFEVVLINDGGPSVADSVAGVADVLAVQLVELTDHVGKSEAINEGFRRARGRYLCILDDDDVYLPNHLAVLLGQVTERPDTPILYTDTEIVLTPRMAGERSSGPIVGSSAPAELLMMRGAPIACSICIRRDAWSMVDGFDRELIRVLDDWDFYMRLSRHFDFVHVPVVTSQYTQPPGNKAFLRFPSFEAGLQRMREKLGGYTVPLDAALALDVALDKLRFDQARAAADITLGNVRAFAGSTPQDGPLEHPVLSMAVLDPVDQASDEHVDHGHLHRRGGQRRRRAVVQRWRPASDPPLLPLGSGRTARSSPGTAFAPPYPSTLPPGIRCRPNCSCSHRSNRASTDGSRPWCRRASAGSARRRTVRVRNPSSSGFTSSAVAGARPTSRQGGRHYPRAMRIESVAIVVDDYDSAIEFFVVVLGFELVEDSGSLTGDDRPKRWVVVRPPGAETGIVLAQADGVHQAEVVGKQVADRVGFFLRVDDFDVMYEQMVANGVEFVTSPRSEPYGRIAVFLDVAGNRWDLLGPDT